MSACSWALRAGCLVLSLLRCATTGVATGTKKMAIKRARTRRTCMNASLPDDEPNAYVWAVSKNPNRLIIGTVDGQVKQMGQKPGRSGCDRSAGKTAC